MKFLKATFLIFVPVTVITAIGLNFYLYGPNFRSGIGKEPAKSWDNQLIEYFSLASRDSAPNPEDEVILSKESLETIKPSQLMFPVHFEVNSIDSKEKPKTTVRKYYVRVNSDKTSDAKIIWQNKYHPPEIWSENVKVGPGQSKLVANAQGEPLILTKKNQSSSVKVCAIPTEMLKTNELNFSPDTSKTQYQRKLNLLMAKTPDENCVQF